jgi:hypothetical protein
MRQQRDRLDASGLSNLLNSQQQQAQANAPDVMSMLGSMLDQNKDGSGKLAHFQPEIFVRTYRIADGRPITSAARDLKAHEN